ncbi:MAG: NAD(P)H-quinone oxidoreductase [Nevskia sp.]|nr:NAD(P)H-quinone oxidoreductase [Nevskia sp.]
MNDLPTEMRVIEASKPGGPEVLGVAARATPRPAEGEVLIRVAAAGLNRADLLQRRGVYPPPPGAPDWPGLEVAGRVAALGPGVTRFAVGDPVCALLAGGGYAEYCVVAAGQVLPVPAGLTLEEAASLPEAYFTVWSNIFDLARLEAGRSLLVHGGASGIGVAAIQLANALGAQVFATAGSDERCRLCETLGAVRAVNYRGGDFASALAGHIGSGVDVVLDMVAGDYLGRNLELLAPGGHIVIIAAQGGSAMKLDALRLMAKNASVSGTMLRPRPAAYKARIGTALRHEVWPLLEARRIRPVVDKVFAFDQAAAAHAYMESGQHAGKIVLSLGA